MSTFTKPSRTGSSEMDIAVFNVNSKEHRSAGNRFQQLWNEAENAREANRLLEESLEALVQRVQSEVSPYEQKLGLALRRQLFKLITFSSRKSLLQWQRAILDDWIAESINTLAHLGLVDNELRDHLAGVQAQSLNIGIDENSDISVADQLADALDEQFAQAIGSGHAEFEDEPDDGFDYDSDEEAFEFEAWFAEQMREADFGLEDDNQEQDDEDKSHASKLHESNTLFKTWFHRAARAIHPDKVTDPKEKDERQVLMTQLLEARRNQDVMSMLSLYREYVEFDVDFSEQDLAELEAVLRRFIELQEQKESDLILQSPLHQMVYENFYNKNAATVKRKIKRYLRDLHSQALDLDQFSESVKSLKALKPYLEDRYDQMHDFSFQHRNNW